MTHLVVGLLAVCPLSGGLLFAQQPTTVVNSGPTQQSPLAHGQSGGGGAVLQPIPLRAHDLSGVDRSNDLFQAGVPIGIEANLTSPAGLYVAGPSGAPVPAQFRVMQRWGGNLNNASAPIQWLLVEFRGSCPAFGSTTYTLSSGSAPSFPVVSVTDWEGGFLVDTGAAHFEISRKTNHLFESVYLDLNGDGQYDASERVLSAAPGTGAELVAADDVLYSSAYDAPQLTYLADRSGPAAARIKVAGLHRAEFPWQGVGRDVLRYTTYLEFAAGSSEVRAIHTLRNDYVENAIGPVGFRSYDLKLDFRTPTPPAVTMFGAEGASPVSAPIGAFGRMEIYQDSSAGPAWWKTPGTSFPGYRIEGGSPHGSTVLAAGGRAYGITDVSSEAFGLTLAIRHFWQSFPKAVEVLADGEISIKLFPDQFAGHHWLDDEQNATSEILYAFHKGPHASYAQARAFQRPVRPCADLPYIRKTRAWPDNGDLPYPTESGNQFSQIASAYRTETDSLRDYNDDWGWTSFGEMKWYQSTHTSGSPRNVLTAFPCFAQTGRLEFFEVEEEGALHGASVRTFHLGGFLQANHPQSYIFEGVPFPNLAAFPDDLGRSSLPYQYLSLKWGIPVEGHGWNGFDDEHLTIDQLYEYTLLTGNPITEEAIAEMAEEILTFPHVAKLGKEPLTSRGTAWTLRSLLKAYAITGKPRYGIGATTLIKNLDMFRGKAPNAWATAAVDYKGYFQPANDTVDAPWQMGILLHPLALYYRWTGDPSVLQMMIEFGDYLCGPAWGPNGNFKKVVKTKDSNQYIPCGAEDGVGIWVPSGLYALNELAPKPIYTQTAQAQWNFQFGNPAYFTKLTDSQWHWWQVMLSEKQKAAGY
jgi:exo-rhamnogalacturonan lyase-like protein